MFSKCVATTRSLNMQSVHVVTVIIFIMFEVFINAYTSYSVIFLWNYLCWSLPFSFLSRNILFIYFLGGGGPAGFLWSHIRQSGSPCMKKKIRRYKVMFIIHVLKHKNLFFFLWSFELFDFSFNVCFHKAFGKLENECTVYRSSIIKFSQFEFLIWVD